MSDDRISHLSHLIQQSLEKDPSVERKGDREAILRQIKRVLISELKLDEQIDGVVRQRLSSYSRKIVEGSPEWDILYQKTFNEEMKKRRV
ncbi:MAG: DUF507 family protein [Nitrospirae bacterium]|nr:DUF507 family protein [Candidatus Manganitrophaceae bacterium]